MVYICRSFDSWTYESSEPEDCAQIIQYIEEKTKNVAEKSQESKTIDAKRTEDAKTTEPIYINIPIGRRAFRMRNYGKYGKYGK